MQIQLGPTPMKISEVTKYQVFELIGEGSYGSVYRGGDRVTGQEVALKVIYRKGKTRKQFDELRYQIEILKKLEHPNIIKLIDNVESSVYLILVMQFAATDLATSLQKATKFGHNQIKDYAKQIIDALIYLNQNRIVHRDLKPQNILLTKDGRIKLCDFGFARKMSAATICLHSLKGTPLYIAPQIIDSKPYGHKIDVWSLGIILYQMAVGAPPYYAQNFPKLIVKILNDKPNYPKNMDVTLKDLIDGMLQKNPNSRYDWPDIQNHPYFTLTRSDYIREQYRIQDLAELTNSKTQMVSSFNADMEIADLITIENHLRESNSTYSKGVKKNVVLYHQLMILFTKAEAQPDNPIYMQSVEIALRILLFLVTKVKLDETETEQDVTRKPDLPLNVVRLFTKFRKDSLVGLSYQLLAFLLKINFSNRTEGMAVDDEEDIACQIVEQTAELLVNPGAPLSPTNIAFLYKTLGIVASQMMTTLERSPETLKSVNETKLLKLLIDRIKNDKEAYMILQCVQKFIHPMKGSPCLNKQTRSEFLQSKQVAIQSLIAKIPLFLQLAQNMSITELEWFFHILYEGVCNSSEFRRQLLSAFKPGQDPLKNSEFFSLVLNYKLASLQNGRHLRLPRSYQETEVLNTSIFKYGLELEENKANKELLQKEYPKLINKSIEWMALSSKDKQILLKDIVGWTFGHVEFTLYDIIADIVITAQSLPKSRQFLKSITQSSLVNDLMKLENNTFRITSRRLVNLLEILASGKYWNLQIVDCCVELLRNVFSEEQLGKIKQREGDEYYAQFIFQALRIVEQLLPLQDKDQKVAKFASKLRKANVHRALFTEALLKENILVHSLKVLQTIIKADQEDLGMVLDFLAVQGLNRLKQFYSSTNSELLVLILVVVSHLARMKVEYYSSIHKSGILDYLNGYILSPSWSVRAKALQLVANLFKHSPYFKQEFETRRVLWHITQSIPNYQPNVDTVNATLLALGNIAFFDEIPKECLTPCMKYIVSGLRFQQSQTLVKNTITTVYNLLRHSDTHVSQLVEAKVLPKILKMIIEGKATPSIIGSCVKVAGKAMEYECLFAHFDPKDLRSVLEKASKVSPEVQKMVSKISLKLK